MTSTLETRETDGLTGRRWFRVLRSVLAWGLLAALAYLVWPSSLGGGTTTIVVNGHSMEDTYYTGDIVIARTGEPQVGDIVVYTTADLGDAKIVHRIVGGDGETGWDLQGDNNDFIDPFHPTNDEVIGIAKIRIPSVGAWAQVLSSPLVWGSMLLVALGLIIWPSKECPEMADEESEPASDSAGSDAKFTDFTSDAAQQPASSQPPHGADPGSVRE